MPAKEGSPLNRGMITASVMLAAIMTVLDSTIANVALPHMAGSMSASADQITWVLTSYIIATAIMTPITGWLAGRLGVKRVFVVAIGGFTIASALCGAAQNLPQIVVFRLLQGLFGAAMMPLSQSVMLDTYPLEERGGAMAIWGMGVTVAPILGPIIGGWLTDDFSWRWVFFINLPIGVICLLGVFAFLPADRGVHRSPLDGLGFFLLSVSLAAFQLFLDRGQHNDWFSSAETGIEAVTAVVAFVLFVMHVLTADRPFLPRSLFRDQNFLTANILNLALGLLIMSALALLPTMLETLMDYPVITTDWVMAPRGIGAFISMFAAGRLIGRVDTRALIAFGLTMFTLSYAGMSHFSLLMDARAVTLSGFIQGLGSGLVFTPMTILAFATLPSTVRADAASVFALVRNVGNSAGISIMQTVFVRTSQVVHARLVEPLRPDNPIVQGNRFDTMSALAALDGEVNRQASMVAYVDVFHLMFVATLVLIPTVLILRPPRAALAGESSVIAE